MLEHLLTKKYDIEQEIKTYNERLKSCPNGSLWIVRDKDRKKYYHNIDGKISCIGRNKNLIYNLAMKKFYEFSLVESEKELNQINSCIKKLQTVKHASFSKKYPSHYEEIFGSKNNNSSDSDWENEPFISSAGYPEQLTILTSKGIKVRSKSEAIIVELLHSNNIPFRYECDFEYFSRTYHPDFTIKRPKDGSIVLWEHFGLLDDVTYRNLALNKLQAYSNSGFILGNNLIVTWETRENPFSYVKALAAIKDNLL